MISDQNKKIKKILTGNRRDISVTLRTRRKQEGQF